jgi:hypothetical protein
MVKRRESDDILNKIHKKIRLDLFKHISRSEREIYIHIYIVCLYIRLPHSYIQKFDENINNELFLLIFVLFRTIMFHEVNIMLSKTTTFRPICYFLKIYF